jgi:hypothetical protein
MGGAPRRAVKTVAKTAADVVTHPQKTISQAIKRPGKSIPALAALGGASLLSVPVAGATLGPALIGAGGLGLLAANKYPKPPGVDTSSIDVSQQADAAANAVLTADAEARRARSAKRRSSALGSFETGADSTSVATLQPAAARKSVLG